MKVDVPYQPQPCAQPRKGPALQRQREKSAAACDAAAEETAQIQLMKKLQTKKKTLTRKFMLLERQLIL